MIPLFYFETILNHKLDGTVSTFAGCGTRGHIDGGVDACFDYPTGIAVDQRNGDIFVSEPAHSGLTIRKITQQSNPFPAFPP